MTKQEILDMETIAYYDGIDGIEIKKIGYDIDDRIFFVTGCHCNDPKMRKAHNCKIYYQPDGNDYFKVYGHRVPLNECIRTNIV